MAKDEMNEKLFKMSVDLDKIKTKCRLCFQRAGSARKSAIIDEEIQQKF